MYGNSFGPASPLIFGAAIGTGVLAADLVTKYAGHGGGVEKSIEQRVLEVGLGGGIGVMAESYVFGTPAFDTGKKFAIAAAAEMVGEYAANSLFGFR
jgi:hypothetical protein